MRRRLIGVLFAATLLTTLIAPAPALAHREIAREPTSGHAELLMDRISETIWGWLVALIGPEKGQIVP